MKKFQKGISNSAAIVLAVVFLVIMGIYFFVQRAQQPVIQQTTPGAGNIETQENSTQIQQGELPQHQNGRGNSNNGTEYSGALLAGTSAPMLDFVKSDYDKALASDKLVVLYFYANWCPICKVEIAQALYPAFNELTTDQVIGFRVNYNDNETNDDEVGLAREFGVAYQHTKVFVKNGQRILKSPEGWNKDRYINEIISH